MMVHQKSVLFMVMLWLSISLSACLSPLSLDQPVAIPDNDSSPVVDAGSQARGPLPVYGLYTTSIEEPWVGIIHAALVAAQDAGDITYVFADGLGTDGKMGNTLRQMIAEVPPAIVFADAFGNEASLREVAQAHPEIAFVLGSDEEISAPNLSVFNSWIDEPAYLGGLLAGGLSNTGTVGIVAGYSEGAVNRAINAFTAGARAVNPEIEILTTYLNSWYDPAGARKATLMQIEGGADVIYAERDGVIEVAATKGVYTIGNLVDQQELAPTLVVTSLLWDMLPAVQHVIAQVAAETYRAADLAEYMTMAQGGSKLAPINEEIRGGIPSELLVLVERRQAEIVNGDFQVLQDDSPPVTASTLPQRESQDDAVLLGALYNLSGIQAGLDIPSAQGAQLAVDQANLAGGLLGRPVELIIADGESSPAVITTKTNSLMTQYPEMVALLGFSDTDMVLAAAPTAAAHGRLFLTSGATSPLLPAEVPGALFLACFGDNVQAAAAAEWAYNERGARTAAVLYDASSSYTQLLQTYFVARFKELGGEIVAHESYTSGDSSTIHAAINRLVDADLIYLSAGPEDAPEAARLLRAAEYHAPILGGDGFDLGEVWQQYADLDNIFFTTHAYLGVDNPDPKVQNFLAAFAAAYPDQQPSAFAALGYDAALLLMQAITAANSTDPEDVRTALAAIQHFDGVTGELSFAPNNPIPSKAVTILGVQNGAYVFEGQVMPEKVPAPDLATDGTQLGTVDVR